MTDARTTETRTQQGAGSPASQTVSWWPAHEFITALAAQYNNLPTAGTPAWQQLPDTDPRKLIALAAAGEHHVLRVEVAQQNMADASKAVASSPNWRTRPRGNSYIPRKKEIA